MSQSIAYQPLVLVETADLSREEWLEYRRLGIGGSDAAAVLGISPFRTARDLYYDKLNIATADDDENWVAKEMGNLLEPLVAKIFAKKTGLKIYQRKCMFQHPFYPWMLADLDYLVELPDGTVAILEIKTTNYNAKDHWWYNGKEIVPVYYESQGRHYMAVMNIDRVYFCCLYGNNEDEAIIRHIDRDMDYEAELIEMERCFWHDNVLSKVPPPYTEDGELILESLRRQLGPSEKDAPPAVLAIYDHELNCRSYYWGDYKNKSIRWVAGPIVYNYYFHYYRSGGTGRVYGKTLPQLEKTVLRSTGLVKWLRENHLQENPKRYLRIVGAVPQLEQIMKANLPRLASECIEDADKVSKHIKNREATALTKALGIDSQELARLRKHNGGALMLGWLQKEKEYGRPIADEVISWFCSKKIDVFKLDFIWGKMNPLQIYHYLQRQMKESGESAGQVLTTWQDYLSMAEKLGIDTSDEIIYRARLLRLRHDELVKRMKEKSSEQQALDVLKKYPNVDAICQSVKDKFEYENEQYAIVAPCSALDIIVEGQMLHHCVGSSDRYWDRIERHEAYVLFLRKTSTPHIPYYTLEVEPDGTVRQTRTKFDRQEADIEQARAFLQEWQAVAAKRLTASDREKAGMSRVLREQEFEQMRKDDVRISFGDLAGRRLVDVLAADLMENAA